MRNYLVMRDYRECCYICATHTPVADIETVKITFETENNGAKTTKYYFCKHCLNNKQLKFKAELKVVHVKTKKLIHH